MKRRFGHILLTFLCFILLCVSCSKDGADLIPRSKLAQIYAEMLLTDQWILNTPNVRTIADTSLVYEPILEKYGYDSDDYRKSLDVYMDDPERYSKVFREAVEILDKRLEVLNERKSEILKAELRKKEMEKYRSDFKPEEFFPYMFDEPYIHYYDSVSFVPDSLKSIYRLTPVERADTIYDRIEMIILKADTLEITDSLPCLDSIDKKDTIIAGSVKKNVLNPIYGKK